MSWNTSDRYLLRFTNDRGHTATLAFTASGCSDAIRVADCLHCNLNSDAYEVWLDGQRIYHSGADGGTARGSGRGRLVVDVIDHDDAVRKSTRMLLETCNFRVREYPCAEAYFGAAPPRADCILVDSNMPNMGALELVEQLRSQGHLASLLLTTDRIDRGNRLRAHRCGAVVLTRPLSADQLIYRIKKACQNGLAQMTAV